MWEPELAVPDQTLSLDPSETGVLCWAGQHRAVLRAIAIYAGNVRVHVQIIHHQRQQHQPAAAR